MSLTSGGLDSRHHLLLAASAQGKEARVREILAETPTWNSPADLDALRQALQKASARGSLPIARLLLEHGAATDPPSGDPRYVNEISALYRAAEGGRTEVASLLLKHGANANWQNKVGATPLFPACLRGHVETLRVLLRGGASVDHRDVERETPLLFLARQKNFPKNLLECVTTLIACGADLNAADKDSKTPLIWAATNSNLLLVSTLLTNDFGRIADVHARTNRCRNALHIAAETSAVEVVKVLLSHGADPCRTSEGGWTALHNAAQKGHADIVSVLIEYKSRVNAQLSNGMTPLHWAAAAGHEEAVNALLDARHCDVTIKDNINRTPMLCAAQGGHYELARRLAPSNLPERLPGIARRACQLFNATIYDFNFHGGKQRPFKEPVYKLLYEHVPVLPRNVKHRPSFRWIHLPANNASSSPFPPSSLRFNFFSFGCPEINNFGATRLTG